MKRNKLREKRKELTHTFSNSTNKRKKVEGEEGTEYLLQERVKGIQMFHVHPGA